MFRFFIIGLLITTFANGEPYAQSTRFTVKVAPFSSRIYDEFSPVFYQGGIAFCSNQRDNALVGHSDEQNRLFKIFFVSKTNAAGWKLPKILAGDITSDVNDGPVTFSKDESTIYYSRNNYTEKSFRNISDTANKLGIYSAEFVDGRWTNIKPFPYNNPNYSFCTPALSPDGERIYFSSDMPGGNGGMDLYYCDRLNDCWGKPVNMGTVINTTRNESFPFAGKYGKLFFASDGHPGFGGKDIFYTQEINGEWIVPVHLDSAINSPADDFGLVADSTFERGYFSTNRRKTDDIFSFNQVPTEFTKCDTIQENKYCFTFYDERYQLIDTIPVSYEWDFGNGIKRYGTEVKHCFPGGGTYVVKLSIIDMLTGEAIAEQVDYAVELNRIEQGYINSNNVGLVNKPMAFDGAQSCMTGCRITDYLWDFGDGFKQGQPYMTNTFRKKGEYTVQLGLLGEKDSLGRIPQTCIMKKIRIFDDFNEMALNEEREAVPVEKTDSVNENQVLQIRVYIMQDLSERQKEIIEHRLKSSERSAVRFDRTGIKSSSFGLLDDITAALREDTGIRLEIAVYAAGDPMPGNTLEISEKWAQELAFYFRNHDVPVHAVHVRGMGLSRPVFKPMDAPRMGTDGLMELVFMKN